MTTTVKCKPILFSSPMVRAIIASRKTQTRRIVKPQPPAGWSKPPVWVDTEGYWHSGNGSHIGTRTNMRSRIKVGDVLWVREKWRPAQVKGMAWYAADCGDDDHERWKPSIHMPYSVCRLWLEVTGVRVERVQDISEADAMAEGIDTDGGAYRAAEHAAIGGLTLANGSPEHHAFQSLWASINGPDSWAANPWVWVYEFKRTERA